MKDVEPHNINYIITTKKMEENISVKWRIILKWIDHMLKEKIWWLPQLV